jgi:hypothetical protein
MAKYLYQYNEERGDFYGYVEDYYGDDVWSVSYPELIEDEESGELYATPTIFDDGFMKNPDDVEGLEDYLKSIGILEKGDELVTERDEIVEEAKDFAGRHWNDLTKSEKDDLIQDRRSRIGKMEDGGMNYDVIYRICKNILNKYETTKNDKIIQDSIRHEVSSNKYFNFFYFESTNQDMSLDSKRYFMVVKGYEGYDEYYYDSNVIGIEYSYTIDDVKKGFKNHLKYLSSKIDFAEGGETEEYAKGGSVTMGDLERMIEEYNEEGRNFELRGAYGNLELWSNGNRLEVGSKKDIKQALIKYRFNEKYASGGSLENKLKKKLNETFELPMEIAIYVPSTRSANEIISKKEFASRIEEVQEYLSDLFGGYSSVNIDGGYISEDKNKGLIREDVARVTSFGSKDGFEEKFNTLVNKIVGWCKKWSQESIGFEFEGDMFYVGADAKFKYGGETEEYAKGGNIPTIAKKVEEVNKLINDGNEKGVEVIDESTTWQSPMKYKPFKYSNGVLYEEYEELDLYSYNRGEGTKWKTKKYKFTKNSAFGTDDQKGVLNQVARMYRKAIKHFDNYGYANGGVIKWQDVNVGDSANVKAENKTGLIVHTYGRKFHLKFANGSEKTYDASELEFIQNDDDEFGKGGVVVPDDRLKTNEQSEEERELELYIDNDVTLYNQRKLPIEKNLIGKLASGKFDINQAPKIYKYLIDDGIKKYTKDFGGITLTKDDKENLAKNYVNQFLEDADSGQFDEFIPKKYRMAEGGGVDEFHWKNTKYGIGLYSKNEYQGVSITKNSEGGYYVTADEGYRFYNDFEPTEVDTISQAKEYANKEISYKMARGGGFDQYGNPYGFYNEMDSVYELHHKEDDKQNAYKVWDKMDGVYVAEFPSRQRAIEWIERNKYGYADGGYMEKGGGVDDDKKKIELNPITTKRDSKGFRFYSTENGKVLYAEKNNDIYNVNEDTLKPTSIIPLQRSRFKFVGLIDDKDVSNSNPLHYERETIKRVRKSFGFDNDKMAKGGEIKVGDTIYRAWFTDDDGEKSSVIIIAKSQTEAEKIAKGIDDSFSYVSNPIKIKNEYILFEESREKEPIYKMAKGGATFDEKVASISESLIERKKVSPKVQKDYGKTYNKKEAIESAKRIAGALRKKEMAKKKG